MKTEPSIITPTQLDFRIDLSQIHGSAQMIENLAGQSYYTVGTTSSLSYVTLFTIKYTVDVEGLLTVSEMTFDNIESNNDANGECKLQISGDGGNTFVDVTGDIGGGILATGGAGLWINNVEVGKDKLQVRILGRSTDGNPANIILGSFTFGTHLISKTFF